MDERKAVEDAGWALLDRFMEALNNHDAAGMDDCMHFPHPRLAEGNLTVYDTPGANPMDLFARLRAQDGWLRSTWDSREMIQWNAVKSHWRLTYTRYRDDGSVIGTYDSLYILTKQDGHWGIQLRSSFGP